jgi:hypothetical protein
MDLSDDGAHRKETPDLLMFSRSGGSLVLAYLPDHRVCAIGDHTGELGDSGQVVYGLPAIHLTGLS